MYQVVVVSKSLISGEKPSKVEDCASLRNVGGQIVHKSQLTIASNGTSYAYGPVALVIKAESIEENTEKGILKITDTDGENHVIQLAMLMSGEQMVSIVEIEEAEAESEPEEEEVKPARGKASKKKVDPEDLDLDADGGEGDGDEGDGEEDAAPVRGKGKKKVVEEEEEEAPTRGKGKKPVPGKKKPAEEEDLDLDGLDLD